MASGIIGFVIQAQSWVNSFRICVTSDTGLIDNELNRRICELIEEQIQNEKIRTKDMPIPETPPRNTESDTKKDR